MSTRRRQPEPPPLELKQFTPDEIRQGIAKLQRRINEVKALETDHVRHDNQRVRTVAEDITTTILEVFGENSPQYRAHGDHLIWHGPLLIAVEDHEAEGFFRAGIPQTITMLKGLIDWLERKRAEIGQDATVRVRAAFEDLDFHPRIADVCADLYRDGHYRNAVLDASVALMNLIKERSRRHDLDGVNLMRVVFSNNIPILAFNDLKDQTDLAYQEGMMHLFEGAVLALRNPRAHALCDDSPEDALEYIALLSLLAKHLERTKRT